MTENNQIAALVGDTPAKNQDIVNPFHLHFTGEFRHWLAEEGVSLAFTTYEGAKLIIIGPGFSGGTVVTERHFERCMALYVESDRNIWISTHHHVWRLENGLKPNMRYDGWDRIYLPRTAYVTGGVDVHDLAITKDGTLLGVITQYNCIASIGKHPGSFTPVWKPSFISQIIGEDRCHLNGFCIEGGSLAYVSVVGISDIAAGWREHKRDGGVIIDVKKNQVIASGLSMPHTPRLYQGKLWFLEAGRGYVCVLDLYTGKIERPLWRPGFLRGLRFYKHYAFVCSSEPRDKVFAGLPLQEELDKRGMNPQCAVDVIDMRNMEVVHSVVITGAVKEIYDVAVLPKCKQPVLYGILGDEIRKIVVLGDEQLSS